jgi:hypothetical protein
MNIDAEANLFIERLHQRSSGGFVAPMPSSRILISKEKKTKKKKTLKGD